MRAVGDVFRRAGRDRRVGLAAALALVPALSTSALATSCSRDVVAQIRLREPRLLDLSRPGDLVYRQVLERADRFGSNDGRGDRLRSAQRERRDGFAATRSECRGARRILLWRSRRARGFDLCRPRHRNLSLQLFALRHVGRARRGQDLRALRRAAARAARERLAKLCWRPKAGAAV